MKNNLKSRFILVGFFITLSLIVKAQESSSDYKRINELYISSYALSGSNFGLQFKSELKNNKLFRFGLLCIESEIHNYKPALSTTFPSNRIGLNLAFEIGIEKRKKLNNKFSVFYGLNLMAKTGISRYKIENPALPENLRTIDYFYIYPGISLNSGILLNIKNDFYLGAEIAPQILFTYTTTETRTDLEIVKSKSTGGYFRLNTESLRVSLIYRWNKK